MSGVSDEKLLDVKELAEFLGLNPTHLAKKVREDAAFPRLNLNPGGERARYRFSKTAVMEYLQRRESEAEKETSAPQEADDVDPLIRIS